MKLRHKRELTESTQVKRAKKSNPIGRGWRWVLRWCAVCYCLVQRLVAGTGGADVGGVEGSRTGQDAKFCGTAAPNPAARQAKSTNNCAVAGVPHHKSHRRKSHIIRQRGDTGRKHQHRRSILTYIGP